VIIANAAPPEPGQGDHCDRGALVSEVSVTIANAAAHGWVRLGRIVYATSTEQTTRWLAELRVDRFPVRALRITGAPVSGVSPIIANAAPREGIRGTIANAAPSTAGEGDDCERGVCVSGG
jgi:hypothetical protein